MKVVPTLNLNGWVKEPTSGMSELLAMYFNNKYSQSELFEIKSIMFDLASFPDDIIGLCNRVQVSLTDLYTAYFPEGVEVSVTNKLYEKPYRNYHLEVSVSCVVAGKTYSIADSYEKYDGGFKRYVNEVQK